jgi:hypothetical protein
LQRITDACQQGLTVHDSDCFSLSSGARVIEEVGDHPLQPLRTIHRKGEVFSVLAIKFGL